MIHEKESEMVKSKNSKLEVGGPIIREESFFLN